MYKIIIVEGTNQSYKELVKGKKRKEKHSREGYIYIILVTLVTN